MILKEKYGALVPSDIRVHKTKSLFFICIMSFVSSLLGNAIGLGGGFIFNPA
jgi:hypothetical protein